MLLGCVKLRAMLAQDDLAVFLLHGSAEHEKT